MFRTKRKFLVKHPKYLNIEYIDTVTIKKIEYYHCCYTNRTLWGYGMNKSENQVRRYIYLPVKECKLIPVPGPLALFFKRLWKNLFRRKRLNEKIMQSAIPNYLKATLCMEGFETWKDVYYAKVMQKTKWTKALEELINEQLRIRKYIL